MTQLIWSDDGSVFFRLYDEAETEAEFGALAEGIFGPRSRWHALLLRTGPVFANPEWTGFAVGGHFLSCHGTLPPDVDPFPYHVDDPKSGFVVPDSATDREIDAINDALEALAERDHAYPDPLAVIFHHMIAQDRHEVIQLTLSEVGFRAAGCYPLRCVINHSQDLEPWLGMDLYRYLFDRTGQWGVYSDHDDVCIVGGAPDFMASIVEEMGGMAAIKARYDQEVMQSSRWPDYSPYKEVYDAVGWRYPTPKDR